jgi:hypothetical protein
MPALSTPLDLLATEPKDLFSTAIKMTRARPRRPQAAYASTNETQVDFKIVVRFKRPVMKLGRMPAASYQPSKS